MGYAGKQRGKTCTPTCNQTHMQKAYTKSYTQCTASNFTFIDKHINALSPSYPSFTYTHAHYAHTYTHKCEHTQQKKEGGHTRRYTTSVRPQFRSCGPQGSPALRPPMCRWRSPRHPRTAPHPSFYRCVQQPRECRQRALTDSTSLLTAMTTRHHQYQVCTAANDWQSLPTCTPVCTCVREYLSRTHVYVCV
jgi:hypothetical protein